MRGEFRCSAHSPSRSSSRAGARARALRCDRSIVNGTQHGRGRGGRGRDPVPEDRKSRCSDAALLRLCLRARAQGWDFTALGRTPRWATLSGQRSATLCWSPDHRQRQTGGREAAERRQRWAVKSQRSAVIRPQRRFVCGDDAGWMRAQCGCMIR